MRYLPSLPDDPKLGDVLAVFPKGAKPLFQYVDRILRGPSQLTIGQRELIGVVVSKANKSAFCVNAHATFAAAFGIPNTVLNAVQTDASPLPVDEKMRPILQYAQKLALTPKAVEASDVEAILDAGWGDEAVFDVASVVGMFSLINRLVCGLGIAGNEAEFAAMRAEEENKPIDQRLAENKNKQGDNFYYKMFRDLGVYKDE